ncbi:MAG: hypothetical protein ACQETL_05890 [Bacteroidota bacterium]
MYCEEPQEIAPPSPGGGGGSTDLSGSDGLCEHPFIGGFIANENVKKINSAPNLNF